jgi:hypothetical protein
MNKKILGLMFIALFSLPSISFAKAPLFFQTGDELFEIKAGPDFGDGYHLGYACKRLGLFGADIWTWDCELSAVNLDKFSVGDLEPDEKSEMSSKYTLGDRERNPWNHYGFIGIALMFLGSMVFKSKS